MQLSSFRAWKRGYEGGLTCLGAKKQARGLRIQVPRGTEHRAPTPSTEKKTELQSLQNNSWTRTSPTVATGCELQGSVQGRGLQLHRVGTAELYAERSCA
jgi:hypothetical protein